MHYTQKAVPRGSGYADQQPLAAATQRAGRAAAAAGEGALMQQHEAVRALAARATDVRLTQLQLPV